MSKDKIKASEPAKTQRCWSLRRHGGMWLYEHAVIPEEVFRQYVTDEHGPDLFGMCAAKLEVDVGKARGLE